jgi:hypothetical protein
MASYYLALRGLAEIMLLHLRKSNGYKEPAWFEGKRGHHPED